MQFNHGIPGQLENCVHSYDTTIPDSISRVWDPGEEPAIVHKGALLDELLILIQSLIVVVKVLLVTESPGDVDILPKLAAHVHSLLSEYKLLPCVTIDNVTWSVC